MNVQRKVWEFVKTSIIISLTTLLLILSLEIFLRYFFPQKTQASSNLWHPLSSPDDQLGYVLRPNSQTVHWNPEFYPDYEIEYKINKQGFRDHQIYNQAKAQNTLRLLVLGDSFTFGVANNYSKI